MPLGSIFAYAHLAPPTLSFESVAPFSRYLGPSESSAACKLSRSQMLDCVLLVPSANKSAKLVHHPMIDVRTPLNPNGRDELWALIGHGATSSPVFLPDTIFHEVQGACPPFKDMATAGNAADFISLVPSAGPMMRGSEPPFHGKRAIVLPPFLAKAFMDVDMEDAAELALVGLKSPTGL